NPALPTPFIHAGRSLFIPGLYGQMTQVPDSTSTAAHERAMVGLANAVRGGLAPATAASLFQLQFPGEPVPDFRTAVTANAAANNQARQTTNAATNAAGIQRAAIAATASRANNASTQAGLAARSVSYHVIEGPDGKPHKVQINNSTGQMMDLGVAAVPTNPGTIPTSQRILLDQIKATKDPVLRAALQRKLDAAQHPGASAADRFFNALSGQHGATASVGGK
ncbi:MAG: hypothetical protein KGR26_16755, partial [Cyanobacteria bacterium REEB65]|nr:hypothetical protein [Cyanobacteria bacterium REEB65]